MPRNNVLLKSFVVIVLLGAVPAAVSASPAGKKNGKAPQKSAAPHKEPSASLKPAGTPDFSKEPTFIKSDSLTLHHDKRYFIYSGNVEVKQGDMVLTAATLEGYYDQDNKIDRLIAKTNVLITKGDTIRGTCELATYEAAKDLLTLTENPELTQEGSILTGDTIKVFLKENRSEATGQVRVKMVEKAAGSLKDLR